MSALDQAFIKAYAKEPQSAGRATGAAERSALRTVSLPPAARGLPQTENLYSAGTVHRIETPRASEPEAVPPPHFAPKNSRRLPLRYRLAQMDLEEVAPPAPKRVALAAQPAKPKMVQRIPEAPVALPEELPAEPEELAAPQRESAEARLPAEEIAAYLATPSTVEIALPFDDLLAGAAVAESTLVVWPEEQFTSQELDVPFSPLPLKETKAEPLPKVETSEILPPAKSFRLDAAHAPVPPPHQPPQPTVEELIQPAAEAPASPPRPQAVSAEEAAALVGTGPAELPEHEAATVIPPVHPLVPAWEVDRFLWPALCDKLLADEHSYFAQAGGKIVSAVRDGLRTLAITGSRRGEGRTTLALCLARTAAKAGLKVAVVDADFARPQLAAALGLEVSVSWREAAQGRSSLAESAVKSVEDNLTVLPLDVATAGPPLSLANPRVTKTLREAAAAFDLVILDLGPTAAGNESIFPEEEPAPADAAIVVRDLRYCTPSESQAIGERLSLSGIEAVGIAENFVPVEKLVA